MNNESEAPVYSFWPLFLAIGMVMTAIGVVWTTAVSVLGILLLFASIIGWTWENRTEKSDDHVT